MIVIASDRSRIPWLYIGCPTCGARLGEHCFARGNRQRWGDRVLYYRWRISNEGIRYSPHGPRLRIAAQLSLAREASERYAEGWYAEGFYS